MEFIPIYLLITTAVVCVVTVGITRVLEKDTVLNSDAPTFVETYLERLRMKLERSRVNISLQQYHALQIGCPAALAFVAYFISPDRSLMLVFLLLGIMMPNILITIRKNSESKKFEDRFVRALAQLASSLHSGSTIEQAIESVVNCELLHDSIREDFRILSSKIQLGASIQKTFTDYAEVTGNPDVQDVATTISIMNDLGGETGEAIEKLQKNIEDRLLYRKKRESMLTESKIIVFFADAMPIIILAGSYLLMPDTIQSYFQNTTMTIVFFFIMALLLIGSIIVHKMLSNKIDIS